MLSFDVPAMAEDFKPGVQHICVPNAARDGWDCGTVDDPPKPAVVEEPTRDDPVPAPPPFLADPTRPRSSTNYRAEPPVAQPEPEAPVEAAPIVEAEVVPASPPVAETAPEQLPAALIEDAPVAETVPEAVPETMESQPLPEPAIVEAESLPEPAPTLAIPEPTPATPEPVADVPAETIVDQAAEPNIEPVLESAAEPEPTPEPAVTHTSAAPETSEPVTVETMPEPTSQSEPVAEASPQLPPPAEPEPRSTPAIQAQPVPASPVLAASSGKLYLASLQGARAFGKLPPAHFTLQLAHASTAENFPELIQQLGIDFRQCYVLRVRRDGGDWWVLAYGSFQDVNAAKAALIEVRPAPGMTAVWPRRIGNLQGEYQP